MFGRKKNKNNKNIDKTIHRVYIELDSQQKVSDFTNLCNTIPEDIVMKGVDENGVAWETNAKSLLFNLAIAGVINDKERMNKAEALSKVDWNTVFVESEADIYNLLKDFAKG